MSRVNHVGKLIIVLCVALTSCVIAPVESTKSGEIIHMVLIWLNEPGNEKHIQQVIEASNQLKEIPGIKELKVGSSIPSDRKIVDDSFDVGVYMMFDDLEYMQAYLIHPVHKKVVTEVIKPLSSKIKVHDFEALDI